jgi:hypothetical protein
MEGVGLGVRLPLTRPGSPGFKEHHMSKNMVETLAELTEMNITENLSVRHDFEGVKVTNSCTTKVEGETREVSSVVMFIDGQKLRVTVERI